ncbi:hypothetical protein ACJRO7_010012 [Eucalyptus globulus]|uniref:Uncharacterized protein n=1 Tax=Eucalyptus globulus TaxID=34317 RepID=A0ABD3LE61_EUCGL
MASSFPLPSLGRWSPAASSSSMAVELFIYPSPLTITTPSHRAISVGSSPSLPTLLAVRPRHPWSLLMVYSIVAHTDVNCRTQIFSGSFQSSKPTPSLLVQMEGMNAARLG